ncbi:class I SAM-dependent methyltransferase [Humibacillus xanthopallidus]|uniref:class I SAM-dependent methyltransferase n=1 Tax=Humibacillus xanthopallidus TaxID=412689 RepID=UPI0038515B40
MAFRTWVGRGLNHVIGAPRADHVRLMERRVRNATARRIQMTGPAGKTTPTTWVGPDPFVEHPRPTMSRHTLLKELHHRLQPRTYLEVGVNDGASLALSRARSIGVDPSFRIVKELECDVQLVRATSDDFFARDRATSHFGDTPVDLAFIDGMHLSDFALRDFMNIEPLMAPTGVVVVDDVLPRNGLEASRKRMTSAWTGDVYKMVEVLKRHRPDLVVLLVNTAPTGTAIVTSLDPRSTVLRERYEEEVQYLHSVDPQRPPMSFMNRSISVEPQDLLSSTAWERLLSLREQGVTTDLASVRAALRSLSD